MRTKTKMNNIMLFAGSTSHENIPIGCVASIAMLPLRGKPIIWWQLNNLKTRGIGDMILVLNKDDFRLANYVKDICSELLNIKIVFINRKKPILSSLKSALKEADLNLPTRVILGDTFLTSDFPNDTDLFLTSKSVSFSDYWCLVDKNKNEKIENFYDKKKGLDLSDKEALIGYYSFSDTKLLYNCTKKARLFRKKELSAAFILYKEQHPIKTELASGWFDLGHTSGLIKAKNNLFNARDFNSIKVDTNLGLLTKSSTKIQKLEDEANWYNMLPSDIQVLCPRFISFEKKSDHAVLTQELYGYPSLSELFLSSDINFEDWKLILEKLFNVHKYFEKYSVESDKELINWLYKTKTKERVNELCAQNEFWAQILAKDTIKINNKEYKNFPLLTKFIDEFADEISRNATMTIVHGDYCFSNILFDSSNYTFKLIDPRGRLKNTRTIYGDPRYDIAKLRHSICGLYDFVVNGLCKLNCENDNFEYEILAENDYSKLQNAFDNLVVENGFDLTEIKFIEVLLFLSMVPLHKDDLKRQKVFYLKAVKLLNEVITDVRQNNSRLTSSNNMILCD